MILHYFMDPLCGWCYGFSPVIQAFYEKHKHEMDIEVIAGGMVKGKDESPIGDLAPFLKSAYKRVEETAGVTFGEKFHDRVEDGKLIYSSVPGAIAMSVFRSFETKSELAYSSAIQNAIYAAGIDPSDMDYYADIAVKYGVDKDEFLEKTKMDLYRKDAYDDFSVTQQFKVTGYPTVILHAREEYFLLAKGYTNLEKLEQTFESIQHSISA